jgi:thymidylate synthase
MVHSSHRNISFATAAGLRDLLNSGATIDVRGQRIRELRNRLTVLRQPQERCLLVPHRGNDVVATVAEALWVIAGRDDIKWLSFYLPRAPEFSDDGMTWHGAYGPRLRNWNGLDQLNETRQLLLAEGATRRAVMSLFDPARDFVQSRDIPCNNWIQWLIRDGRLHATIGVRSNDIIWGFSGVNSFQWSVVQEMMAYWTDSQIGDASYLATSFHLYNRHEERARRMIEEFRGITCYDFGLFPPAFQTSFDDFDDVLAEWFALEEQARSNPDTQIDAERRLGDPLLAAALELVRVHNGVESGWSAERLGEELGQLRPSDLVASAYEFYGRKYRSIVDHIPDPQIAAFMAAYHGAAELETRSTDTTVLDGIKTLHAQKNAAYGPSWKKRGELFSILANIERKVDRLGSCTINNEQQAGETGFDTAVDLFVYLIKYRLFLTEHFTGSAGNGPIPRDNIALSDSLPAFNALVDQYSGWRLSERSFNDTKTAIKNGFERLYALALEGKERVPDRVRLVIELSNLAFDLVRVISERNPDSIKCLYTEQTT